MPRVTQGYNLQIINPTLAKEWHVDKNGGLLPKDFSPGSNRKVWWICGKSHEWESSIKNRNNGTGCPYCSGKKVCDDNCLKTLKPSIAREWHPTKNRPLTPTDVTLMSNRRVWWICAKGHEWQAIISNRNQGTGCPYCSGKKVCRDNCLQTLHPKLADDWHYKKNKSLKPKDVTPGSSKTVWWICTKGHEWKSRINHRVNGSGCPYCAGQAVCKDNCLETVNPKLSKEWHPTKNGRLTPQKVTPGSHKKVWWIPKQP